MSKEAESIWEHCSGGRKSKPWFVVSVIGDSKSFVPSTWDRSSFLSSLIDMAKGANECWIFNKSGNGKLSLSVQRAVQDYIEISSQDQSEASGRVLGIWKNAGKASIKLFGIHPTEGKTMVETVPDPNTEKTFEVPAKAYKNIHVELLKIIKSQKVKVMRLQKDLTILIPVVVLVAEGDVKTIRHVEKLLSENVPILLIKGSGKATDVIVEYLSDGKEVLKSKAPTLLGNHTTKDDLDTFKRVMKSIKRKKHLVSVYDDSDSSGPTLSETATQAIIRAWATRKSSKKDKGDLRPELPYEIYPIPDIETIANFEDLPVYQIPDGETLKPPKVIDPDGETLRPPEVIESQDTSLVQGNMSLTFGRGTMFHSPRVVAFDVVGDHLGSKTVRSNNIWLNPSSFPLYFFIAYQLIQTIVVDENQRKKNFESLLVKAVEADKLDYVRVLLQEHDVKFPKDKLSHLYNETVKCKLCKHEVDCQHVVAILKTKKIYKSLFEDVPTTSCLTTGRQMCAEFLHYPNVIEKKKENQVPDQVSYEDLLIWSLFANRPQLATLFWNASDNQLVTALLACSVLKRMAVIAKETSDQSVYSDLLDHAKIFEKRSLEMQSDLYNVYPSQAMDIISTEFTVWDIKISPMKCAYDNDMNDFIAHPCVQRCLNTIWYKKLGTNINVALKKGLKCREFRGQFAIVRLLSAPFTKFVLNYIVFLIALVAYSVFLLTNINSPDTIGGPEIFVYIWMFSDILEEYVVPGYLTRRSQASNMSDKWYRFCRYIHDFWNALDTISYITTFVAIGLRFSNCLVWARRVYSFSLFFVYMRFLYVFLIYRKVGVYVILIKEMIKDLARFLIILVVFMIAVGVMYHVNRYPNHSNMWSSNVKDWRIWDIMSLPYWQIYGEVLMDSFFDNSTCTSYESGDVDRCATEDWIVYVIAALYMLLSNLLLVNLVIALFSARFEKVRANSEKIWRYLRYSYVMDFKIRVPSVINIILRPIMLMCFCLKKSGCKSKKVEDSKTSKKEKDPQKRQNYLKTLQALSAARCS